MSLTEAMDLIRAERFTEAEATVRASIGRVDHQDHRELCHLFGLLGSILNSLGRHDDATDALRNALNEALRLPGSSSEVGVYRHFLANQYLNFGNPEQAIAVIEVVPPGVGHVQCLLHILSAKALWALGRQEEARRERAEALAAAPNDERRSEVVSELDNIWDSQK
jgi:tetratricopeptide (TPR) repeat protein